MPARSRLAVVVVLGVLALAGCGGDEVVGGDVDPVTAPTTVPLAGETLTLNPYAWRDQMPTVGSEAGPCAALCVNATVALASGEVLPDDLEVQEVVAVVDGEPEAFAELDLRGLVGPSGYEFVARGGPALEPGTTFDLVVRLSVDGRDLWLRAPDVAVERTA